MSFLESKKIWVKTLFTGKRFSLKEGSNPLRPKDIAKNAAIIAAIAMILALIFFPDFSRYQKLSAESDRLKAKIEALQKANAKLEKEKYQLEHDLEYVEKKARDKLGIVRKDEIPYKKDKGGKK